jgi:hypothetical protein
MKTIIETSLEFSGVSINAKTAFDPSNEKKPFTYDLSKKSGVKTRVWYDWEENGEKGSSWKDIDIPAGLDEAGVKDYILTSIIQ